MVLVTLANSGFKNPNEVTVIIKWYTLSKHTHHYDDLSKAFLYECSIIVGLIEKIESARPQIVSALITRLR